MSAMFFDQNRLAKKRLEFGLSFGYSDAGETPTLLTCYASTDKLGQQLEEFFLRGLSPS
jgi:hypothetical protein